MKKLILIVALMVNGSVSAQTWMADNGDGTFTNPLFYDEFSDPDLIRVGEDYYMTGTTMHSMPGLPVLHSKDLVNWKLISYAFDRLDLGPEFRLEDGKEAYGQGIWAPCFRYHNGTFYIFSNVNRRRTQMFRAKNPAGPWTRTEMNRSLHDLSVLFDTDGKVYVIWGYQWSLSERPGFLRLHSLPATDLWWARNTLTQRAVGPVSIPTAELDARGMKTGAVAGLALFNLPYAWIGIRREAGGAMVEQFDQATGKTTSVQLKGTRVWLRAHCDFLTEKARFSYSEDGKKFEPLGAEFTMIFQLKTFQGIRYSLFHYHTGNGPGGYADFDKITVNEPHPRGLMRPIPFGKKITLSVFGGGSALVVKDGLLTAAPAGDPLPSGAAAQFKVVDRRLGRVALQWRDKFISVSAPGGKGQVTLRSGRPADSETFQWTETPYGDLILLSLVTRRHLRVEPGSGAVSADHPGPQPDRKDGSCLRWREIDTASGAERGSRK